MALICRIILSLLLFLPLTSPTSDLLEINHINITTIPKKSYFHSSVPSLSHCLHELALWTRLALLRSLDETTSYIHRTLPLRDCTSVHAVYVVATQLLASKQDPAFTSFVTQHSIAPRVLTNATVNKLLSLSTEILYSG